jgi:HAE1 family hydrophobic/amphiphilic exporter-1
VAILVSGFVSLSLSPMLCSRFIKHHKSEKHGRLFNFFENGFDLMLRLYESSLTTVLKYRFATLIFSILLIFFTVYLFRIVPGVSSQARILTR